MITHHVQCRKCPIQIPRHRWKYFPAEAETLKRQRFNKIFCCVAYKSHFSEDAMEIKLFSADPLLFTSLSLCVGGEPIANFHLKNSFLFIKEAGLWSKCKFSNSFTCFVLKNCQSVSTYYCVFWLVRWWNVPMQTKPRPIFQNSYKQNL